MTNFAKLVPIPPLDTVNIGLSPCHQATMLKIFGRPGALSVDCSDVTNSKLDALIETRNVGPFKATGIGRLLDDLQAIFAEVKEKLPELFSQVKTDGMLCCRAVRGSTENFSNHSWGTAIDIRFGDDSDEMGDGLMQLGTSALAPFFHVRGWYWGVGFAQSNPKREDSMHFEASDELIRKLFGGETGVVTLPLEVVGGTTEASDRVPLVDNAVLKSDLLKGNNILEAVADGHLVLHATGGFVDGIGPVQDALNQLGFTIDLGSAGQFKGFFGEKTKAAVQAFQTSTNIDADGRVGSDTIKKLDESLMASAAGGKAPAAGAPTPAGTFAKTRVEVFNRGIPPVKFLQELVAWGKTAPEEIFTDQPGNVKDIYATVTDELGPFEDITHRKACMLEVMRVLAGFESSWDFNEGVDTSRASEDTSENSEAGAWQVSADSLRLGQDLKDLVKREVGTFNGVEFQRAMKANHPLAMEYIARLMRHTRMANGPLYKGTERSKLSPKVRAQEQSIYPWISRDAVAEFQAFLA
jgi:Putative peptidoglycan binding domain/D-alanyl-D-alanine carboxypeptidase